MRAKTRVENRHHRSRRGSRQGLALGVLGLLSLPFVLVAALVLTNGSFLTDITTGWADATTGTGTVTWDGADGQPAGSLFMEAAGKTITVGGYLHQTVAVNAGDTVTLSFYWKKAYVVAAAVNHILFVEIQKPDAQVVTLWTDSVSTQNGAWTLQNLGDISSNFDQTGNYQIRLGADFLNGNNKNAKTQGWFDEIELDVSISANLTLGDGNDPGPASLCPGGAATHLDSFTFQTDGPNISVSAVEVDFAAGTTGGVGLVEITDDSEPPNTTYGSAANPADPQSVTLSPQITATSSLAPYRVRLTPKSHAAMPAPAVGTADDVTGIISSVTAAAGVLGSDIDSATVSIDNLSPDDPGSFTGVSADTQISLSWSNPGGDFDEVVVLRRQGAAVSVVPVEGTDYTGQVGTDLGSGNIVAYVGSGTGFIDLSLTNGISYYYEIFAKDACGNYSTGAPAGPYQPASLDGTEVVLNTATESSCKQVTVTADFTGDLNNNGFTSVLWDTDVGFGSPTTSCATLESPSPRQCLVTGFPVGTDFWVRVDHTDPDGVAGTDPEDFGPFNTTCGADTAAPTLLYLSPSRGATVGGAERVKVQVFDEGGLAAVDPVQWSMDGGGFSTAVTANSNYDCGTNCTVYEFDLDTTAETNSDHYLTVKATDNETPANVAETVLHFTILNSGVAAAGDGYLLRRTHSSGLCTDCHNIQTHSSQYASTKYGNWALDCLTCHAPHYTRNIHLIRESLQTPTSGEATINFQTSDAAAPFAHLGDRSGVDNSPYNDGICEACHTKTSKHTNSSLSDHAHEADNATSACVDCHSHAGGFRGPACNDCHFAPPNVGKHWSHDELQEVPTAYDNLGSSATATEYGFSCAKCHTGTHFSESVTPYSVEVVFDTTVAPTNPGATYTPDGPSEATDPGANGDGWNWSDGSCSNLYCHSNAARSTPTYQSVTWDQVQALTCFSCHDNGGVSSLLSGAHAIHTDATTSGGDYQFGCVRCHADTVFTGVNVITPGAVSNKAKHVDGTRTILFDASGPDNSGGSYSDSPGFTCSDSYCHSTGQDRTAPYTSGPSIAWTDTAAADCTSCHGKGGAGSLLSLAHEEHTWAGSPTGEAFGCVQCHSGTVTSDTQIGTAINHVNGVADVQPTDYDDVATGTFIAGANEGEGTCSNIYCHSTGQDPTAIPPVITYHTVGWNDSPTTLCALCHGTSTSTGAPDYANGGTAADDANSHPAHVGSSSDCATCHVGTTSDGLSTNAGLHIDGSRQVDLSGIGGTYTPSTKTCSGLPGSSCHATQQWGGPSLVCLDCHGDPTTDTDDWVYDNGTIAKIAIDEWNHSGHGASAAYDVTGTPGADFGQNGEPNPCLYCHDSGIGHGTVTNPFRLRNVGAATTPEDWTGNCLACHGDASTGVDLGNAGDPINSTLKITSYHFTKDHTNAGGRNGGQFCWDCHDPHGDRDAGGGNILMVHREVARVTDGVYGVPDTSVVGPPAGLVSPVFTNIVAFTDYAVGAPDYDGICNVCHSGLPDNVHAGYNYRDTHPTSPQGETTCTANCHAHVSGISDAFVFGAAGEPADCLSSGCHDVAQTGTRSVHDENAAGNNDDFAKQSHHVGNGSANMGGTLSAWDCIVCHAEGKWETGEALPLSTSQHIDGKIDLWDVDSAFGTYYTYDVAAVRTSAGAAANWNSSDPVWRTQTSTQLDPFCLTCHDSDGAVGTYNREEGGGDAQNPFGDTHITNEYDQAFRFDPPVVQDSVPPVTVPGPEKVVNVYDQVVDSGGDIDGDGTTDPTGGVYARHAIRGQSTSRYGSWDAASGYSGFGQSIFMFGGFTSMGTDEFGNPNWNDTSVMGCADCHTTDGANTTAGNAHGSGSEYLLKDNAGGATEGNLGGDSYVCYRCHELTKHGPGTGHTSSSSDYVDVTDASNDGFRVLDDRGRATNAVLFGIACLNCHGAPNWGTIHGTSQQFERPDTSVRQSYRFMNGGSQRYYVDNGWEDPNGTITCWTLGAADEWGSCTKHDAGYTWDKPLLRQLDY